MKRLCLAVLALIGLTGCEAIKTKQAEARKRQEQKAIIAEREFLESFAPDYAAWLVDWEKYMASLPEPPLPE